MTIASNDFNYFQRYILKKNSMMGKNSQGSSVNRSHSSISWTLDVITFNKNLSVQDMPNIVKYSLMLCDMPFDFFNLIISCSALHLSILVLEISNFLNKKKQLGFGLDTRELVFEN
ncbi:hypothetical protein BpHYR1_028681 [Brachionus plicatilis]|uniref:Uncharacterized protein n=1 Tax=Brachionus plicatilis TaxID=10195 RepID=A0A3M7TA03_BRAPC|nr:hypothetical protein BpHYR1_028681 [Brachionus plicatilis]